MAETALHICIVSPSIYPLFNTQARAPFAEPEIQLFEYARFWGKLDDIEVSVVTGDYKQEDVEYYSGVLVYRAKPGSPIPFLKRIFNERTQFQNLLKKIDADVYLMSGASELAREVAEFCKRNHRAFVYRVAHQRDCDGSFTKSLNQNGEDFAWALKHASCIVCQTEMQQTLLRRTEKLESQVIPNAVPVPIFPQTSRQEVVWIGEIVEWKQSEMFFRLALTLPSQSFTILAYPRDMEYFERLVEKTRDIPNLGFQNNVPYHEVPYFLERSKLLVNTSRFEGYPFYFTLANAHGVPAASLNIDPDGVMEKFQLGVCAHGSEVRLAEEVAALVAYENQLRLFQNNAYQFVNDYQNITKVGKDFLKVLIQSAGDAKR